MIKQCNLDISVIVEYVDQINQLIINVNKSTKWQKLGLKFGVQAKKRGKEWC